MLAWIVAAACGGETTAQAGGDSAINRWNLFRPTSDTSASERPHPAVVRVIVDEGRLQANGTGSLVGLRDQHGLVVTNWHVVREARGPIHVVFPDNFRSEAVVLKTDEDWDLAALLVWRPSVQPLVISSAAPQPGEPLTIAGYGSGNYRSAAGKCTQYVAPSARHPYEIVELSAEARQGDSGGPILNSRGELAGVLFGASRGSTSGSYCGRVRWFLSAVWPELAISRRGETNEHPLVGYNPADNQAAARESAGASDPNPNQSGADLVPIPATPQISWSEGGLNSAAPPPNGDWPGRDWPSRDEEFPRLAYAPPPLAASPPPAASAANWEQFFGRTSWDRAKSVLAIIGILTVWSGLSRWITQ